MQMKMSMRAATTIPEIPPEPRPLLEPSKVEFDKAMPVGKEMPPSTPDVVSEPPLTTELTVLPLPGTLRTWISLRKKGLSAELIVRLCWPCSRFVFQVMRQWFVANAGSVVNSLLFDRPMLTSVSSTVTDPNENVSEPSRSFPHLPQTSTALPVKPRVAFWANFVPEYIYEPFRVHPGVKLMAGLVKLYVVTSIKGLETPVSTEMTAPVKVSVAPATN